VLAAATTACGATAKLIFATPMSVYATPVAQTAGSAVRITPARANRSTETFATTAGPRSSTSAPAWREINNGATPENPMIVPITPIDAPWAARYSGINGMATYHAPFDKICSALFRQRSDSQSATAGGALSGTGAAAAPDAGPPWEPESAVQST